MLPIIRISMRTLFHVNWKILIILLLSSVCLASCGPCTCPPTQTCPTPIVKCCLGGTGFEDLSSGDTYIVPNTINSSGLSIFVMPFQGSDLQWVRTGHAEVRNDMPGGTDIAMFLNNVNLGFDIQAPGCVTIQYCELGGNINIANGGVIRNEANLHALEGASFPDFDFHLYNVNENNCGTIELKGGLTTKSTFQEQWTITFAIGGEGLYIDDVCPCQ